MLLRLHSIRKTFGDTVALQDVSLSVREGEFLAMVGPSGCGKSTLLQIVAGLLAPSQGEVMLNDRAVTAPPESCHG